MRHSRSRRAAILVAAGLVAVGVGLAGPASATEVSAAAGGNGWLRLGHFSPDTKEVDVRVTALRGGSTVLDLSGVGYGDISPYTSLADGTYTIAMVPAGEGSWDLPVISEQVTVSAGGAATVAAYGPNVELQVRAFTDDLTTPAAGAARIRVIQASTQTPAVSVQTTTGVSIAADAAAGEATDYTEVPAGSWTFELTGGDIRDTSEVNVAAGSVSTLFVLDTADGGLTILPVLDSAAAGVTPEGGVATGGGWLSASPRASVVGLPGFGLVPV